MIFRPGGLVSRMTPDRGDKITIQTIMNVRLMAFTFQTMEYCSKDYTIKCVNSTSVLQ